MARLDLGGMKLGPDGIEGFYWPVDRQRLVAIRDKLVTGVAGASRRWCDDDAGQSLMLVSHFFIQESLAVAQANMLGADAQGSATTRLWKAAARGSTPEPSPYLAYLAGGLRDRPRWRRIGRPLAGPLRRNAFSYRWLTRRTLKRLPVATTFDHISLMHAEARSSPVVYAPISPWFRSISDDELAPRVASFEKAEPVADMYSACMHAFEDEGLGSDGSMARYLHDHLVGLGAVMSIHLERLLRAPESLPRELWTGTGGILWSRTLRHAVSKVGGVAIGHDHAEGHGHFSTDMRPMWEFPAIDEFVTFNPVQAAAIRKHLRPEILVTPKVPEIKSLPPIRGAARVGPDPIPPVAVSRVMYIATTYTGERVILTPLLTDLVATDWQARLFTRLRSWGFEVLFKPHPDSKQSPPVELERLATRVVSDRLEDAMDQADLFILDLPQSTTFGTILRRTNKPVIVVDLGFDDWDEEAIELLTKRIRIVPAKFDSDNRVQVEWDSLHEAIKQAPDLQDPSFARSYLSYGG